MRDKHIWMTMLFFGVLFLILRLIKKDQGVLVLLVKVSFVSSIWQLLVDELIKYRAGCDEHKTLLHLIFTMYTVSLVAFWNILGDMRNAMRDDLHYTFPDRSEILVLIVIGLSSMICPIAYILTLVVSSIFFSIMR